MATTALFLTLPVYGYAADSALFTLPETQQGSSFISEPCQHYQGRVDAEGKWGSQRNIGELALFVPVACDIDRLFFSDIRIKADNESNQEFNFGLGLRRLKDNGILGGYAYYDRRKSGLSKKLHTQLTAGVEWLGEDWEIRGNTYIPLSGEVSRGNGSGSVSDPQLIGSGVFVTETSQLQIREEPMYGIDVEVGKKVPHTGLWLFGGGFAFRGNDVPNIDGVRARARYEFNDYFALTAEGQYDSVRGKQGWLGFRVSVPFGKNDESAPALQQRMTALPVRDVDIVIGSSQKRVGTDRTIQLDNPDTSNPQRIIYVDNTAAGGGDGSLENPFNNLADADASIQDGDVVYIYAGAGSAGLDSGLDIEQNNVRVIGAGSNLVFDGSRITATYGSDTSGTVLIAATSKPVLTNAAGSAINLAGSNSFISGITVDGATNNGASVIADGVNNANTTIENVTALNATNNGVLVFAVNAGRFDNVVVRDVYAESNGGRGVWVYSYLAGSVLDDVQLDDIESNSNGISGVYVYASTTGTINNVEMRNIDTHLNTGQGIDIRSAGGVGSVLGSVSIDTASSTFNARGLFSTMGNSATMTGLSLRNADITDNTIDGVSLNNDSAISAPDYDFGNATNGNNRIFGNTNDLRLDLNGETLFARGNWWGQAGGFLGGQLTNEGACPACGVVDSANHLTADPRP